MKDKDEHTHKCSKCGRIWTCTNHGCIVSDWGNSRKKKPSLCTECFRKFLEESA